jgi:DNA repair protein RecO (recombination protein O)
MTHKTKGIVLKVVKYGETSVIVNLFTELFGIQSYIVNGVRTSTKKGMGKANLFQPAAILDLVVYHNQLKNIQRISDFKWAHIYNGIFFNVHKNAVAVFMVELLQKCLKEPETNAELFYFVEDAFLHLDKASDVITANFSLFFGLHLAGFFGFRIEDEYSETFSVLDLQEGRFTNATPYHQMYLQGTAAFQVAQIMKVMQPYELDEIKMNREQRRHILQAIETFYALHIQEFGQMKTLQVLQTIF